MAKITAKISYPPLAGRKFTQTLLEPLQPVAIFSLIAAGYPVELVFPMTVRALNGVYGRTIQAGVSRHSDPEFAPLVEAMRRIQQSRAFSIQVIKTEKEPKVSALFDTQRKPEIRKDSDFVVRTLRLTPRKGEFSLVYGAVPRDGRELPVLSRSMIEILGGIAADIQVREKHAASGLTHPNNDDIARNPNPKTTITPTPSNPTSTATPQLSIMQLTTTEANPATLTPTPLLGINELQPSSTPQLGTPRLSTTEAQLTLTSTPNSRPTRTPTVTPTLAIPDAAIQIGEPGPLSRIVTPLRVVAWVKPGGDGRVCIELFGEDGRLLVRKLLLYGTDDHRYFLNETLDFEIPGVAETARLPTQHLRYLWAADRIGLSGFDPAFHW